MTEENDEHDELDAYLDEPKKPVVLVVDDISNMVKSLKRHLSYHGFEVDGYTSAEEALQAMESNKYVAVITDMRMPKMSGQEFIEKVSQRDAKLPCIIITGYADKEGLAKAVKTGNVVDILSKPIDSNRLLDDLTKIVNEAAKDEEFHFEASEL